MTKQVADTSGTSPGDPAKAGPTEPSEKGLTPLDSGVETIVEPLSSQEALSRDRAAAEVDQTLVNHTEEEPGHERFGWDGEEEEDRFIGKILANRYKVIRRIGVGGFGAVYEAEDTKIHKRVAIKILARDLITDSGMLVRFRQEAEAASKVGHENIIDVTDFDRTNDGFYFMVMEFLDGVDLGSIIRAGEKISLSRMLGIMIQICRALNKAHQEGIIHRDLKPGNIFLLARGSHMDFVKLLDFGISKFMEVDEENSRLTRTGQIIGTPLYMSPEQALGEEDVDHRVDVYSLGVIMYELLTGQPPFTAVNYLGIIAQHASDPPTPPSKVRPDLEVPPEVELIILKAMSKRPEERFSTMAEMEGVLIHALAAIDPAAAVTYSPDSTPPSLLTTQTGLSRRRLSSSKPTPTWSILAITLFVGLGIGAYFLWNDEQPAVVGGPADMALSPLVDLGSPDLQLKKGGADASAPTAEGRVLIVINSRPAGAEIVGEEGKVVGRTPATLELERSDQLSKITLTRKGYRPMTLTVALDKDRQIEVTLKKTSYKLPDDPKGWGER